MCFSPVVSFIASAALTVTGVATLRKAAIRREWPLASLPLLFAVQQFIEGWIWVVLLRGGSGTTLYWLTQGYSVFVGIIWPLLVPMALFLTEPVGLRRRFILLLFFVGIAVAFHTLVIITQFGVHAEIVNACILYTHAGYQGVAMLILYIIATSSAFFFSSDRNLRRLGAVNIVACAMAYYFYQTNFASVWCLFAAIISGLIYWYFSHLRKAGQSPVAAGA